MVKTCAVTVALLLGMIGNAFAQDVNVFKVRVGSVLTGTEEYRVTATPDGYRVSGTLHAQRAGVALEMTHEETLAPDRSLVRYKLEVAGQVIEAWRDGDQIQVKASAGGQSQAKTIPFTAATTVADNLVTAHRQVLFDRFASRGASTTAVTLLVPQVMLAIAGKLSPGDEEPASLNGKPIRVRKYALEAANVLEESWVEIPSNRLMRIAVPLQNVEIVRDGFALETKPEPPRPAACVERPVDLVNGTVSLPATLCLPAGAKSKVPLLVLVHGSGPNDRDETIGPNKPFRDLADGLAAAGIASLRYDKRTFALKGKLDAKTMTVEDETISDAVAAVRLARTFAEVDAGRVFVLGHSQGAMFAPAIADRAQARGAVLMAPAERPIDDVLITQLTFQLKLAGRDQADIDAQTKELKQAFALVRVGATPDDEVVFGASARYWRDMLRRDVRGDLGNLKAPVLLLQGGKDIQVVRADYDIACEALAAKPAPMREAHVFPNLNHLFMPVEGQSTGAEYGKASHVAPEVIRTIAAWVAKW